MSQEQPLKDLHADKTVRISAKQNTGIEEMLGLLSDMLKENSRDIDKQPAAAANAPV